MKRRGFLRILIAAVAAPFAARAHPQPEAAPAARVEPRSWVEMKMQDPYFAARVEVLRREERAQRLSVNYEPMQYGPMCRCVPIAGYDEGSGTLAVAPNDRWRVERYYASPEAGVAR